MIFPVLVAIVKQLTGNTKT